LAKSNINASFIPKEFGGAGFSEKDRLLIFDKLGANLSVFFTVNQVQTVASLLTSCGTGDQKLKYLPKIASFNYKPAICLRDEPYVIEVDHNIKKIFLGMVNQQKWK
jgi:alkylation response protein AidB-like acyl-CoA dehydrogenase